LPWSKKQNCAVNRPLRVLALLVISVFLLKLKRPIAYTLTPMVILLFMTCWAMLLTLKGLWVKEYWGLFAIGVLILVSALYMVVKAVGILRRNGQAEGVPVRG
jgi:carbon starvation protein